MGPDLHNKEKSIERTIDDASRGSFPASDPPAFSGATATRTGEDDENVDDPVSPGTVAELDIVDLAHGGSFPASDPPGSTGSTATRSGRE